MLAGICGKDLLEVGAAYGQDYLVGMEELSVAGEGHVHQVAAVVKVLEAAGDVVLEVLPAQLELVVHGGCSPISRGTVLVFSKLSSNYNSNSGM